MRPIQALLGSVSLAILASVAPGIAAPASAASLPVGDTINLVATAYGPSLKDNYPYGPVDYYGNPLKPGDVAVDPSVIPLGTHLWITGYHTSMLPAGGFSAVAVDTGGAIIGKRIDIYINAPDAQVSNFGIQNVTVTVVGANGQGAPTQLSQSTSGNNGNSGQPSGASQNGSTGSTVSQQNGSSSGTASQQGVGTTSQHTTSTVTRAKWHHWRHAWNRQRWHHWRNWDRD